MWSVYAVVFADQASYDGWRTGTWDPHVARAGFRLARAYVGSRLVGFGYGYTGERGQWWTDHATAVLEPEVAADWVGGHFELVSLAVGEEARGQGVGTALMTALTAGLPHDRWLLMTTADPADPARRLYDRHGWQVLGRGIAEDQVIMGRHGPGALRAVVR